MEKANAKEGNEEQISSISVSECNSPNSSKDHNFNHNFEVSGRPLNVNYFKRNSAKDLLEKAKGIEEILHSLHKDGSHLWKVRSISKWFRRKYAIDMSAMALRYEPTYKNNCIQGQSKNGIHFNEIVDIRKGWATDTFNRISAKEEKNKKKHGPEYKSPVEEGACFSVIYGPKKSTLDLVAPSEVICDKWVRALQHLLSLHKSSLQEQSYERWLRKQFNSADLDKNKTLNFTETMKLLKLMNIFIDESKVKQLFNEANTRKSGKGKIEVLDEDEFVTFYFKLLKRPEVEELYNSYATPADTNTGAGTDGQTSILRAGKLQEFLQKEYEDDYSDISIEDCEQLINIFEQSQHKKNKQMTVSGFVNMLLSPKFDLFRYTHKIVHQEMNHPLTHYYIASSHNTYLTGNQLTGFSSIQAFIDALKKGCRCVELDCWDGADNEPIIYHGYTLTSKILFKEILSDAIKPYAFATSNYPLILSLENHCTEEFQAKMAEHLKTILGDMLYTISEDELNSLEDLPSPEALRGKVLVKAKRKKTQTIRKQQQQNGEIKSSSDQDQDLPPSASMESLDDSDPESDTETNIDYIDGSGKAIKRSGVTNDLSTLVNLVQAVHFQSFAVSRELGKCFQMSSFSEAKAIKFIEEQAENFVDYNKRQLSRIYPAGSRTSSSNFNPIKFWNVGCQIVALNYQTEDMENFYNQSLFSENGSCGYILKPEFLREEDPKFDPNKIIGKDKGVELTIKMISGQHLPKAAGSSEVVDPYVEIRILGLLQDKCKHTTKVVRNNGFNPVWNETFNAKVKCPELAMIYFRVKDYATSGSDVSLAHFAMPFSALTTGYRHVHLTNLKGNPVSPASLFVNIKIKKCK